MRRKLFVAGVRSRLKYFDACVSSVACFAAGHRTIHKKLDDEWPENIFHHVGSQSANYLLSVQCEVLSRVS